jgi:hypothetical protein
MNYVPLWKQWMKTKEYKDYINHELPVIQARMAAIDKQNAQQREIDMAKEYQLRWVESQTGKTQESKHGSEKAAKDKARDLSYENSPVQVGEVDNGKLLQQWNFEKGRQQTMNTAKQVSVAPISKKEASNIKSNTTEPKGDNNMATKNKSATKSSKATNGAAKAKTQPKATAAKVQPKKTGTIRDEFELREGSNREKLVDCLLAAKGKPVTISGLLKATYGNTKDEGKGPLNMVIKGMVDMIAKKKIKMTVLREKNKDGEVTVALKAK